MIMFLPTDHKGGLTKCGEGAMIRMIAWFIVLICGTKIQELLLPAYSWICFITVVCMTIHIMIYMKLYNKKKDKVEQKCGQ